MDPNELAFELVECSDVEVDGDTYLLVEVEEWEATHKGEARSIIFSKASDERYYCLTQLRFGSPFTDWHYEADPNIVEVEPHTVSRIEWRRVK